MSKVKSNRRRYEEFGEPSSMCLNNIMQPQFQSARLFHTGVPMMAQPAIVVQNSPNVFPMGGMVVHHPQFGGAPVFQNGCGYNQPLTPIYDAFGNILRYETLPMHLMTGPYSQPAQFVVQTQFAPFNPFF